MTPEPPGARGVRTTGPGPSATTVETADVYKAGVLAATLSRSAGGVQFSYRPEYLAAGGPDVASTLPQSDQPVITMAGAVPPFFAGLLPEGRRLSSLRRTVKTSADDDFSLLVAVGSDPVGDVQVVPHGQAPNAPGPMVTVDRSFSEADFSQLLSDSGMVDAVAIAGVQDKASAGMISIPAKRAGRRYILKVDPPEYPGVVQDEAFFIEIAAAAGLPVVHAEVVHDSHGRPGLLVERFDRYTGADGSERGRAVEDGAQVLGIYPADKYTITSEDLLIAMADLCPARPVALRDLFRQLVFAWLTGNGDVHAKNLSLVAEPGGEWRVAPAYDLPSTLPYGDQDLALSIQGKKQGLSRRTMVSFASAIGLPQRGAERVLDQVLNGTSDLDARLSGKQLPFNDTVLRILRRTLRNRRRTLAG